MVKLFNSYSLKSPFPKKGGFAKFYTKIKINKCFALIFPQNEKKRQYSGKNLVLLVLISTWLFQFSRIHFPLQKIIKLSLSKKKESA